MKKCNHELKYNIEGDFVFCTKCGKRWEIPATYQIYPIHPIYPTAPNTTPTFENNPYNIIYC